MPSALSFVRGAPPKRKAHNATSSNDKNDNNTSKRQKTAPDQPNPRQRGKNPKAAKRPGRPRPTSAAIAYNAVATHAAPAPASAATAVATSSAGSNAPAVVQDQASQPTADSNQSASNWKPSDPPLPPPAYRPDACKLHSGSSSTSHLMDPELPGTNSSPDPRLDSLPRRLDQAHWVKGKGY
ncbi:hypothetical protein E8E11_002469 [Didymella keratinophila]|nr:hypothetical protein E8E11_002469 [Didymella keratinophila]